MDFNFKYTITEDDLNNISNKDNLKWIRLILRVIFYPYIMFSYFIRWMEKWDFIVALSFAWAFILIFEFVLLAVKLISLPQKKASKKMLFKKVELWEYKIDFSDKKIDLQLPLEEDNKEIKWEKIKKVKEWENYIVLYLEKNNILLIPLRVFEKDYKKKKELIIYIKENLV